MAQVMTILRHPVMFSVAKWDSLKRNLIITALDALEDTYNPIAVILEDGAIAIGIRHREYAAKHTLFFHGFR